MSTLGDSRLKTDWQKQISNNLYSQISTLRYTSVEMTHLRQLFLFMGYYYFTSQPGLCRIGKLHEFAIKHN